MRFGGEVEALLRLARRVGWLWQIGVQGGIPFTGIDSPFYSLPKAL